MFLKNWLFIHRFSLKFLKCYFFLVFFFNRKQEFFREQEWEFYKNPRIFVWLFPNTLKNEDTGIPNENLFKMSGNAKLISFTGFDVFFVNWQFIQEENSSVYKKLTSTKLSTNWGTSNIFNFIFLHFCTVWTNFSKSNRKACKKLNYP